MNERLRPFASALICLGLLLSCLARPLATAAQETPTTTPIPPATSSATPYPPPPTGGPDPYPGPTTVTPTLAATATATATSPVTATPSMAVARRAYLPLILKNAPAAMPRPPLQLPLLLRSGC